MTRQLSRTYGMRRRIAGFALFVLAAFALLSACEQRHESAPTLNDALEALQYKDADRLVALHLESTDQSVYCANDAMQRLWEKAGTVAESGRCGDLDQVGADEVDAVPDELRFLLQVVRFRCESPNGTCSEYGARALADGLKRSQLWSGKVTEWSVKKQLGDEAQSVAYVDVVIDGKTLHRAVKLRRVGEDWRIESGLLEAP